MRGEIAREGMGEEHGGWGMAGWNRWRVWIAPAWIGACLQGGCQQLGHSGATGSTPSATPVAKIAAPTAPVGLEKPATPSSPEDASQTWVKESDGSLVQVSLPPTSEPGLSPRTDDGLQTGPGPGRPGDASRTVEMTATVGTGNPHQRLFPTANGALLNMAPGESPVERLTKMTEKLESAEALRKTLETRVQQLTADAEQREKVLQRVTREIQEASEEVQSMFLVAQSLRQEMDDVRASLNRRDKDEIETLKVINKMLERMAEEKSRPEGEERTPWRPK